MNKPRLSLFALVALAGLAGCQSSQPVQVSAPGVYAPQEEPLRWVRTDGQRGSANPALADQFTADSAACGVPPVSMASNAALRAAEGCMSARGYALVPESQAAATLEQFRRQAGY